MKRATEFVVIIKKLHSLFKVVGQIDVANYKQALQELVLLMRRRKIRIKGNTKTTTTQL